MDPDAVARAVDELVTNVRAPVADTDAIVARGRRRVRRRQLAVVAGAGVLVAALGAVSIVARAHVSTTNAVPASTPVTATTAPPRAERAAKVLNIAAVSPAEAWMCTNPLQHTHDGGKTWGTFTGPTADPAIGAGANLGVSCGAVAGGNAWALQPTDGGRAGWPLLRVEDGVRSRILRFPFGRRGMRPLAVTFLDADHGWILTIADLAGSLDLPIRSLYRTVDGGRTWSVANENVPATLDLRFTSPTRGWALESTFHLVTTDDGGSSWHDVALPPAPSGAFIAGVVAKGGSVVVWRGAIVGITTPTFFDVSTDGGRTWVRRPGPRRLDLTGATPLAFDAVDAAHWRLYVGKLWTTDNGGRSWTEGPRAPVSDMYALTFVTPDVAWLSGSNGVSLAPELLRTTDGGRTWADVSKVLPPRTPPNSTG